MTVTVIAELPGTHAPAEIEESAGQLLHIPPDRIDGDPSQPRKHFDDEELQELAASIRQKGVVQPLLVQQLGDTDRFQLIAGERRLRAARIAGVQTVPCVVRDHLPPAEVLTLQVLENIRADLRPLEQAQALRRLLVLKGCSAAELAAFVGMSTAAVSRALALLKLPEALQQAVEEGKTAASTAVLVGQVKDEGKRVSLAARVIERELTREQVVAEVTRLNSQTEEPPAQKSRARRLAWSFRDGLQLSVAGPKGQELDVGRLIAALEEALRECKRARQQSLPLDALKDQLRTANAVPEKKEVS